MIWNWFLILLKYFVEFSRESPEPDFFLGSSKNYGFYVLIVIRPWNYLFHVGWIVLVALFKELAHFIYIVESGYVEILLFPYYPFHACVVCSVLVIVSSLFLFLFCFVFICFLIRLPKGLSLLLIFSKSFSFMFMCVCVLIIFIYL